MTEMRIGKVYLSNYPDKSLPSVSESTSARNDNQVRVAKATGGKASPQIDESCAIPSEDATNPR